MSDWRDIHADQNLRLAQELLKKQGEINDLVADNREKDEELQTLASELIELRAGIKDLRDRWYKRPGMSEEADALDALLDS